MPTWSRCLLLILVTSAAAPARADALAELRTTLAQLRVSAPITATVAIEQTSKRGEGDAAKVSTGKGELQARWRDDGLQLDYSTSTLTSLEAESDARSSNPEAATPLADVLREATPTRITSALSYAPTLLRKLDKATLKDDRADSHDGVSRRLLVLDVPPSISAKDRESMKQFSGELKIWLDDAGTPVAVEHRQTFSGRRMLISFSSGNGEETSLRRIGDQLVAVRQKRQQSFSGFGESNDINTTVLLTPQ